MAVAADALEAQEELVRRRTLVERDHGAEARQPEAGLRGIAGGSDRAVERRVGLADPGLGAVDADAHALDADLVRVRVVVEADERRLVEQVRVAVELAALEHDVALRHVDEVRDGEQQVEAFADARVEVLRDLALGERAVVDDHHARDPLPDAVVADLVAEHQREGVVPVREQARRRRVRVRSQLAVHVDAAAVHRVCRSRPRAATSPAAPRPRTASTAQGRRWRRSSSRG